MVSLLIFNYEIGTEWAASQRRDNVIALDKCHHVALPRL
jgi:hypothetical protein